MAYERVNWENLPSTKTPVNADNLNKMDEGIANIDTKINAKQDKLTAGTGIEITDKNTINNINENYSTKEVKIGKWIDGKPLYRKVIESTTFTTDFYPISSNIKQFVNQYGYVQRKDYTSMWQFIPSRIGNAMSISFFVNTLDGGVQIDWGSNWKSDHANLFNKIVLIVEYTKTTD